LIPRGVELGKKHLKKRTGSMRVLRENKLEEKDIQIISGKKAGPNPPSRGEMWTEKT